MTLSTSVIAPANMSVISARWRPDTRSAGSPTTVPITPVTRPAIRRTIGKGSPVP